MAIEFSGLLHTSYLVQLLVTKLAGQPIESNEGKRSTPMQVFLLGTLRLFPWSPRIFLGCHIEVSL